jgi:hypothetical protein
MLHRIVKTSVEHLHAFVSKSFQVSPKLDEDPNRVILRSTILESSISNYSEMYIKSSIKIFY